MILYRVTMTCGGVRLPSDGSAIEVGLVKNEYVLSRSGANATTRAVRRMRAQLQQDVTKGGLEIADLIIEIDEVTTSWLFWRLLSPEGRVFFPKSAS